MDTDDSQPRDLQPRNDQPTGHSAKPWLGRRKRIVARELSAVEIQQVEREMLAAAQAPIQPMDVIDIPGLPPSSPPEAIIDPTQFMERHRRPADHRVYQLTLLAIVITLLASCTAIVGTLLEHRLRALVIGAVACVSAAFAVKFVRSSRLAHRLRGYVAAACVLAIVSMAACFFMPNFHDK